MIAVASDPRPFADVPRAALALATLPADHPDAANLDALATLIVRELPELEAELGCPVVPVPPDRIPRHLPAILIGPAEGSPALQAWREGRCDLPDAPFVAIDRDAQCVVVDGPSVAAIGDAMQLLRTAIAERRPLLVPSLCATAGDVLDRVAREVRRTFPMLDERAPGWDAALDRARETIDGPDDLPALQRLMSTLGDAHSWARDSRVTGRLPYHLHDDGAIARFWSVPAGTAAWEHGVRAGDVALMPDTAPWRERTASVPRTRPWNVGYRALQGRVGEPVALAAVRGDGTEARWTEEVPALPWDEPIEADRLDACTGYLRIRGWLTTPAWRDAFTGALADMARYDRLVVDLRGNVGGALVAAQDARARFLAARTHLGAIRFTTPGGDLDAPRDLAGEPPAEGPRWTRPVRFVTDPLSYSATEDFLQGLQGLPHVQLVGQATGGGGGRPRTIRLREHLIVTISTALTYDRAERCIEGNGLAPDIPIPPDVTNPDAVLVRVTSGW